MKILAKIKTEAGFLRRTTGLRKLVLDKFYHQRQYVPFLHILNQDLVQHDQLARREISSPVVSKMETTEFFTNSLVMKIFFKGIVFLQERFIKELWP